MEKEQKKLSTGVVILIITLVVALVTVSTLFALELLKKDDVSKQQITGENSGLKDVETSKVENEVKEETTTIVENKVEKEETTVVENKINETTIEKSEEKQEDKYEENMVEDSKKIVKLNGEKHKIEIMTKQEGINYGPDEDGDTIYTLSYSVKVNGVEVENIKNGSAYNHCFDNYKITSIEDKKNNKEYIVLQIYNNAITGTPGRNLYIIDENAKVLGNLYYSGGQSWTVGIKRDDTGEIIDYEYSFNGMNVYNDRIEDFIGNAVHRYTIENGKFMDRIVKEYDKNEVQGAGKKS